MRITPEERARFHKIVDDSIDKMNSPKNRDKEHWKDYPDYILQQMINVENAELELAIIADLGLDSIKSENYDLINLNLMMIDNLRGNK